MLAIAHDPLLEREEALARVATAHATGNEKPAENCCSDLLNDECSHFRRGNNYGVECARTQRQRLHLDSCRSRREPYSSRAYSVADRTASASTLRPVAHTIATQSLMSSVLRFIEPQLDLWAAVPR